MTSLYLQLQKVMAVLAASMILVACQSTGSGVTNVGSGNSAYSAQNAMQRTYHYQSNVYLDVAVPVFETGLAGPYDYKLQEAQREEGIWPQVRRLEANRFALDTKHALEKTGAFGSVHVTPDAQADKDLYVLGKIISSNTEILELNVKVMDARNKTWGEERFKFQVGAFFHNDPMNHGKNPYEPTFAAIASWVYDLLNKLSDSEKQEIERVSDLRFAKNYSPEAFSDYLVQTRSGTWQLAGFPAENDPMYQRIQAVKAKEEQFIHTLQTNYETFYETSNEAYSTYHHETYPLAVQKRQAEQERRNSQFLSAGLAILAVAAGNQDTHLGNAVAAVAAVGALSNLKDAVDANRELHEVRDILDEAGSSLQVQISPQVIEFENEKIALQGSAQEQYQQLRQRLQEIYRLEQTPDQQL